MMNDMNTGSKKSLITRRGVLRAFAATTVIAAPTYSNAAGFLRGGGDIRRLRMYNGRTGEIWIRSTGLKANTSRTR